ncbi:MAG: N-acetylmuramoyl-L-alanine amidase [Paludibacteraceae bacterium]|nr:N-acetylmuramoyl-L-alanine amidase [Paludibacteraceae bacterium]
MKTYIYKRLTVLFSVVITWFLACSFTVVIDAGHGGHDPGAIGSIAKEKDLNLAVSKRLAKLIEDSCSDVDVFMTRKTDVFLTLQERANFVNKHNADLFICVHTNSAENKKVTGAETFTLGMDKMASNLDVAMRENSVMMLEDDYKTTYQGFDPNSVESYIMFEFMQDQYLDKSLQFASAVQQCFVKTGRVDRGVRQAGFWVLHKSACPSVLVEMGFITNKEEEQFLASEQGKQQIAMAIFNAFRSYKAALEKRQVKEEKEEVKEEQKELPWTLPEEEKDKQQKQTKSKEKKEVEKTEEKKPAVASKEVSKPIYRVQIFAVKAPLKAGDSTFKGVKNADYVKAGNFYKYMVGNETDYQKALDLQKKLREKFSDCFIVAFLDGKQISVKEALEKK